MKNKYLPFMLVGFSVLTFSGCIPAQGYIAKEPYKSVNRMPVLPCSQKCNTLMPAQSMQGCTPCSPVTLKVTLPKNTPILQRDKTMKVLVVGQGVSPMNTISPAQAYALAKRAAVADAYRLIAEKIKGVYVEGEDYIQDMMVKKSTVRTSVQAMVKNANIVETNFKEGLCEVEMEITIAHSQFAQ
ncbi:LPP20 family lipoprotein [Sulfurimonas sp. SAG-AH-194-I05]|nr:LPP20 family lipoprotein [Sulfurimonas sp. SAG-AH-194-I05]MDF1875535.1 LPP20 family lipoprotein [Sulfurimonas sp. SAG-AH-194-I05]